MTEDVAVRKTAVVERWMESMSDFGIQADPAIASSMTIGTLTAILRGGLEADRDDLAERLWAALRTS